MPGTSRGRSGGWRRRTSGSTGCSSRGSSRRRGRDERARRRRRRDRGVGDRGRGRHGDGVPPDVRPAASARVGARPDGTPGGTRLLVVGPGPLGRAIGPALRDDLGMRVEAVGRTARAGTTCSRSSRADDLHAVLAEADVVLDALPLTPQTRHMFDAAAFAAMKPTARFVNVGRGGTVDERRSSTRSHRGAIAGAALDVFEEEPLPADSPLWSMPNVIVSPHMSGDFEGWEADFAASSSTTSAGSCAGAAAQRRGQTARLPDGRSALVVARGRYRLSDVSDRVIDVQGLRKSYGDLEAVRGIDLHVDAARSSRCSDRTARARRRRPRSSRATGDEPPGTWPSWDTTRRSGSSI